MASPPFRPPIPVRGGEETAVPRYGPQHVSSIKLDDQCEWPPLLHFSVFPTLLPRPLSFSPSIIFPSSSPPSSICLIYHLACRFNSVCLRAFYSARYYVLCPSLTRLFFAGPPSHPCTRAPRGLGAHNNRALPTTRRPKRVPRRWHPRRPARVAPRRRQPAALPPHDAAIAPAPVAPPAPLVPPCTPPRHGLRPQHAHGPRHGPRLFALCAPAARHVRARAGRRVRCAAQRAREHVKHQPILAADRIPPQSARGGRPAGAVF
jgi:hypothetical protein